MFDFSVTKLVYMYCCFQQDWNTILPTMHLYFMLLVGFTACSLPVEAQVQQLSSVVTEDGSKDENNFPLGDIRSCLEEAKKHNFDTKVWYACINSSTYLKTVEVDKNKEWNFVFALREQYLNILLHLHKSVGGGVLCFFFGLSVCVCVCVCKQNSNQRDTPILMQLSLNGCLPHWLKPYWNLWSWIKGQGFSLATMRWFLLIYCLSRDLKCCQDLDGTTYGIWTKPL